MRLAVVISHPIQYYSPWFRHLAANGLPDLRVFYLWDGGTSAKLDQGFGVEFKWDIPLLDGYAHEFIPNQAKEPGPSHIRGLDNPQLRERLTEFQPDAVLLFGYNYVTHYRLIFSSFARKIPLLFRGDSHRLVSERGLRARLRVRVIQQVFRRFAAFLFVGRANRDYFRKHGVPEQRLFFCPHAVDNQRFISERENAHHEAEIWKRSLNIPAGNRVVLFAGKFQDKKRPRDLIEAFKRARLANTTLLMVGNGEEENQLRADAAGWTNIVFVPFQNQSEMPRTFAAADVFVLPSYGETWGLAVNEAMCLARPVILSDHVGCAQDLVRERENGLVFRAGNVPALAGALTEAFSDFNRLQKWGEKSLEIIQRYDYAHATAGLTAALDYVKAPRGGG